MDPLKQATEHHIHIQDVQHQHKKITKEQERILFQVSLANVLLFGAWTLNPEQQQLQDQLQHQYLQGLQIWDTVDIWLTGMMWGGIWTVVSNDWTTIKIQASCYCNKRKENWIRSFSTITWYSKWPLLNKGSYEDTDVLRFYIEIPKSHTVESTAWIPQEALDEINEIYKQAGNETTCYDLVNNLKYWSTIPQDPLSDLIF